MKRLVFLNAGFILLGLASCTQPPDYPIEPVIEFQRLTKNTLIQGDGTEDETWVTISFTDGDGDIGFFQEGSNQVETDLFIRDLRLDVVTEKFTIPFIPELGTTNGISGEITFRMYTTCCIFPDWVPGQPAPCDVSPDYPVDTVRYEIYIKDRAGHESNHIQTEPIYLLCQ
ncbi:MAG: hypothetical protein H6563_09165 [Lewinellaceae bacterium]|nr:hypothetical protein [Lewinellaceae bacterium]